MASRSIEPARRMPRLIVDLSFTKTLKPVSAEEKEKGGVCESKVHSNKTRRAPTIELLKILLERREKEIEVGLGLAKPEATETGVAQLIAEGRGKVEALPEDGPELEGRGLEG